MRQVCQRFWRSTMALGWGMALFAGLSAGGARSEEVEATPACHRCATTSGYPPDGVVVCRARHCYDPCEPVGPVRRFFRRVFRKPCPPPAPCCPVPVVAVVPGPGPVGAVPFTPPPPSGPVVPPPAELRPPLAPPSPAPPDTIRPEFVPPTSGSSYPRLTPPVPELPIRADRIASTGSREVLTGGVQGQLVSSGRPAQGAAEVTLVSTRRPDQQQQIAADSEGKFAARLAPGDWLIYTRNTAGQWIPQGQVEVREHQTARVTILEP